MDKLQKDDELADLLRQYEGTSWMYFTSKPRTEKKLYEALKAQNIPCYLPLLQKTTEYARRIYTRTVPMFPGYVFASTCSRGFDIGRLNSALLRVHFLPEVDAANLLSDLKTVRKFEILAKSNRVEVRPDIAEGTPVVINKGYFKGERGVVEKLINHETVEIYLNSVQMALRIELPLDFVGKNN